MKLSKRIKSVEPSPIRKFTPYAEEAEKRGIKVYRLNSGQPDIKTPDEFFQPIREFNGVLSYQRSQGTVELLESFEKYYKKNAIDFTKDDIVATIGGTDSILYGLLMTCDVGDELLLPEPFYTNYKSIASFINIDIKALPTSAENGYELPSLEEMKSMVGPKTKAILFSNPGNPTGRVFNKREMEDLVKLALDEDLFILADEVYREFVYDNKEFKSFAQIKEIEDRLILLDSISKRYSACGARIGCLASKNKEIIAEATKLAQSNISLPLLEQLGAANLENVDRSFMDETKKEYEKRRNLVYEHLSTIPGVLCEKPGGAFYIGAKLPVDNASDFAKWLLTDFSHNEETIMITPMEGFYKTEGQGRSEVRIAYPIKEKDLIKSMEILRLALEEYNK